MKSFYRLCAYAVFSAVFGLGASTAGADDYSGVYDIVAPSVCDVYVNERSSGSCFVIDARGFVITNFHVVDEGLANNAGFSVGFKGKNSERRYGVESVMQIHHDLALMKLLPKNGELFAPLIIADSRAVRAAEPVFVLGYPMGFPNDKVSVTKGVVSYLYNIPKNHNEPLEFNNYFWIDGLVSPGNSGGPMVNKKGEVIAITTMMSLIVPNAFNVYGPGIGMPSEVLDSAIKNLAGSGKIILRGNLDLMLGTDPSHYAYFLTPEHSTRVRVLQSEIPDLLPNDLIATINGRPVKVERDVGRYIRFQPPGSTASVCVIRSVTKHCYDVPIGSLEEENIFK